MNTDLAARAGRWSAGHWKTATTAWLAFCVVAFALGAVAGRNDAERDRGPQRERSPDSPPAFNYE